MKGQNLTAVAIAAVLLSGCVTAEEVEKYRAEKCPINPKAIKNGDMIAFVQGGQKAQVISAPEYEHSVRAITKGSGRPNFSKTESLLLACEILQKDFEIRTVAADGMITDKIIFVNWVEIATK